MTAAEPPPPDATPPNRPLWATALIWLSVIGLWAGLGLGVVLVWFGLDLPSIDDLDSQTRRPGITVLARDGTVLATAGDFYGTAYTVAELPPNLIHAVMAIEDRRFYHHFGVDPIGLVRALWVNRQAGRIVQGGSTITQQLAKNLFLSSERSVKRKIQEAMLALWLEHRFTKDQLLGIYLNRVYLGAGAYGVDAAAMRYFGIHATALSLHQAALIAGLLKAPAALSPVHDPDKAAARGQLVLAAMADAGYITAADAAAAAGEAIDLTTHAAPRPGRYFVDWVVAQLDATVPVDRDLTVATTLDPAAQQILDRVLADTIATDGDKRHVSQCAGLVLGRDGAVAAMTGGVDYRHSQFNRAVQAQRQPGSSFKLFVYLAALEAGMTPDSPVLDAPVRIGDWSPGNYEGHYFGEVSLITAFSRSLNTAAVRLVQQVGTRRVIEMAKRLGVTSRLARDESIALGTNEVTLIELTGAYRAVADRGIGVWPYGIAEIRDRDGQPVWQRHGQGPGRVLDAGIADAADRLLAEVVATGTGKAARLAQPAFGKTGTTQDYRDAWFIGSAGDLTTGIWFGNDDDTPMQKVTGGDLPAKAWKRVMQEILGEVPPGGGADDTGLTQLFQSLSGVGGDATH